MSEEEFYNKLKYNFFGTKDSEDFKELVKAYNDKSKKLELYKSIIKEAREYIKENSIYYPTSDGCQWVDQFKVLQILDKVEEK